MLRAFRDLVTWFWVELVATVTDVRHTWKNATRDYRLRIALDVITLVVLQVVMLVVGATWTLKILLFLLMLLMITAELDAARRDVARAEQILRLLETIPTGAPRLATFRCPHGGVHRMVYGPNGWTESANQTEQANL